MNHIELTRLIELTVVAVLRANRRLRVIGRRSLVRERGLPVVVEDQRPEEEHDDERDRNGEEVEGLHPVRVDLVPGQLLRDQAPRHNGVRVSSRMRRK